MLSLMVSGVLALFALVHPGSPPQPTAATSTVAIHQRPPTLAQRQAAAHDLENFGGGSSGLLVPVVLLAALLALAAVPR